MSTTTIRLSDELKARVAAAAKRESTGARNFILEAIAEKADAAGRQADFHAEAERRYAEFLKTGKASRGRRRAVVSRHASRARP